MEMIFMPTVFNLAGLVCCSSLFQRVDLDAGRIIPPEADAKR